MSLFAPSREVEAAEIVRAHAGAGLAATGSGSHWRDPAGRRLSSRSMSGILRYRPEDMTITVAAGEPLAAVEAVLAGEGQWLGFEPASARAGHSTIGAVAALNLSGPRRPFAGSARDALLGVRAVTGMGTCITTGARVHKNAAGLDLSRAYAGSRGAFGLITEVTWRVAPRPMASSTVAIAGARLADLPTLTAAFLLRGLPLTGAAHAGRGIVISGLTDLPVTVLRFEGSPRAVAAAVAAVGGGAERMAQAEADRFWSVTCGTGMLLPQLKPTEALWRVTATPSAGAAIGGRLADEGAVVLSDWRGGLLWVRHGAHFAGRLASVLAGSSIGSARLAAGPREAALLGPPETAAAPLLRLKRALDPQGTFASPRHDEAIAA